jgi:hypothetical protein
VKFATQASLEEDECVCGVPDETGEGGHQRFGSVCIHAERCESLEEWEDRSRELAVRVSGTKYSVWMALYVSVM